MNPVRPSLSSALQPTSPAKAAGAARAAAQKAFFELAAGKGPAAPTPLQASAPAAAMRAAAPSQAVQQTAAEAPSRPLRPGSLLDIRV